MRTRVRIAVVVLAALAVVSGCTDGGGSSRSARRDRINRDREPSERVASKSRSRTALASASPEESVKRDLAELKQQEKQQARLVKEMNSQLERNSKQAKIEEERLDQLRNKIYEFEAAEKRYAQASLRREQSMREEQAVYAPDMDQPQSRRYDRGYDDEPREEVIYRPEVGGESMRSRRASAIEQRSGRGNTFEAQRPTKFDEPDYEAPNQTVWHTENSAPARPAPAQQQAMAAPAPQRRAMPVAQKPQEEQIVWNPPTQFFTDTPRRPAQQPRSSRTNASSAASAQPMGRPARTVNTPAPAPVAEPLPATTVRVPDPTPAYSAGGADDGVFYPDRILSGGR